MSKPKTIIGSRAIIRLWHGNEAREYVGKIVDLRHGKLAMVQLDDTRLGIRAVGVANLKHGGDA